MFARVHSFLVFLGAAGLISGAGYLFFSPRPNVTASNPPQITPAQVAAVTEPFASTSNTVSAPISTPASTSAATTKEYSLATTTPKTQKTSPIVSIKKTVTPAAPPISTASSSTTGSQTAQIARIVNPYEDAPLSSAVVNAAARAALVNILCQPRGGGNVSPISGSGVIIDSSGVILTNAHVAQYVLLSQAPDIDLQCQIRTGAPATARWTAEVLYIPPIWVTSHASEINTAHPTGTGEHDYALLHITGSISGDPLPSSFPALPFDTRDAIGFQGDEVLGASYPAEFLGGITTQNALYPVTSVSAIDQLLTFSTSTVDAISIGGVIEAQSGSSGGGVVNPWGRLIGIISTTSDAPTTAGRDLRAITLSYINRDIMIQTGSDLSEFISGDLASKAAQFRTSVMPGLLQLYYKHLSQ